jgi:hypothetical protein
MTTLRDGQIAKSLEKRAVTRHESRWGRASTIIHRMMDLSRIPLSVRTPQFPHAGLALCCEPRGLPGDTPVGLVV